MRVSIILPYSSFVMIYLFDPPPGNGGVKWLTWGFKCDIDTCFLNYPVYIHSVQSVKSSNCTEQSVRAYIYTIYLYCTMRVISCTVRTWRAYFDSLCYQHLRYNHCSCFIKQPVYLSMCDLFIYEHVIHSIHRDGIYRY